MRSVSARSFGFAQRQVMRVTTLDTLAAEWRPGLRWLVKAKSSDLHILVRLERAGLTNLAACTRDETRMERLPVVTLDADDLHIGDVVAVTPDRNYVQVLYREGDLHHTVFLTNRCNSKCIMCSQPPTAHDDSWLVDEAQDIALHMRRSPRLLGFTGGEPLLLGSLLRNVIDAFHQYHPATQFDVLTNGRLFSNAILSERLLHGLKTKVTWMVPLYGHADVLHDRVVRADGAFDQTIDGLLTLQRFGQPVQLRTVLIKPVLSILPELSAFIARNLPFVKEVALMGCEPIGYALADPDECSVDIAEWEQAISRAVRTLTVARIPTLLMNIPLCALPEHLRPLAHRSISDWKQVYAGECTNCSARQDCCGLFSWHARGWRPTVLRPIREAV